MDSQVKKLKDELINLTEKECKDMVLNAFEYADSKHCNQMRTEGCQYIVHPLRVAIDLTKKGFKGEVIIATLLHDVIEDCDIPLHEIREKFGLKVGRIVDLLSKPKLTNSYEWIFANHNSFTKTKNENYRKERDKYYRERSMIYYYRLFNSGNINAAYIKLYDNLDNISSLEKLKPEKRNKNLVTVMRHTVWLAKRFFTNEEFDKLAKMFKKYNLDLPKDFFRIKELKHPILVLPPRRNTGLNLFRKMPLADTKCITIYGNISFLFINNGIKIGLPGDKEYLEKLKNYFPNLKIKKDKSLVPKGAGAYENIYQIEGFRKELKELKITNEVVKIKTNLGNIKIKNFENVDFKFDGKLFEHFKQTKQRYKEFKEKLEEFFINEVK
jgi:hypothetical protein